MRTLLAAACCLALVACGGAQEKPKPTAEEKKGLSVGDSAPPLVVSTWVAGTPVKGFEPGKVYVVEFWATWCGPCVAAMPHLAGLQSEHKDQGLVVVGLTNKDPNNPKEKVEKFVEKRAKKLGYTFGWSDDDKTYDAYMTASGQEGIPCSFVVDKTGKLAFIGHPMELDDVLPKVLAGTWKGEADAKAMRETDKAANEELKKVMSTFDSDPAATVRGFAAFAKKYPSQSRQDMNKIFLVAAMMKAKQWDEAKAASEEHLKYASEKGYTGLLQYVASVWTDKDLNPEKKNHDLAIKAVEAILKVGGEDDVESLMTAAQVYQAIGQTDKALGYVDKAIKSADDLRVKAKLGEVAEQFKKQAEKK